MQNSFQMISVAKKSVTERVAVASGRIIVGTQAFNLIKEKKLPKGDALLLCEIAGIQGAKNTAQNIPLCHPLNLDHVDIKTELIEHDFSVQVTCQVIATAKTGVEMEALSGVNAALLTIYDLTKMINAGILITDIKLLLKTGGKSGVYRASLTPSHEVMTCSSSHDRVIDQKKLIGIDASVVTLSDRVFAGIYADKSGVFIQEFLKEHGACVATYKVLPDEKNELTEYLLSLCEKEKIPLILLTGGTGLGPRDVTPEILQSICTKMIPGIGELLRQHGAQFTQYSWCSRSCAGIYKNSLLIALPGSLKAVQESLPILVPLLPHFIKTLIGGNHD